MKRKALPHWVKKLPPAHKAGTFPPGLCQELLAPEASPGSGPSVAVHTGWVTLAKQLSLLLPADVQTWAPGSICCEPSQIYESRVQREHAGWAETSKLTTANSKQQTATDAHRRTHV